MPEPYEHPDPPEPERDEDDPDAPQARDVSGADEDETPTVPCPHCRREIPDFADRCPYCGDWVVQSSGPPARRSVWFVVLVVIAVLLILAFWVF
jgi:hypothetical protein